MPHSRKQQSEAGQKSRTHGLNAIAERGGPALLDSEERMTFLELKASVSDPAVRDEIKAELVARLVLMMRVGFDEMEKAALSGTDPFRQPVVSKLGTYLNLLDRLLRSYPKDEGRDHFKDDLRRIQDVIERHKAAEIEETVYGDNND